jgi:hypothetical protein
MSAIVELVRSRRLPKLAVLALMFGLAGCSTDTSTRFSQNSYSNNPFAFDPEATSSAQSQPMDRRELPQYSQPQSPYLDETRPREEPLPREGWQTERPLQ